MPSSHLIFCHPLFLLPPIPPRFLSADTKNCNLKHTNSLESHFLYDLLFQIMIYKRFAVGLFPWARLRFSLVCVLKLCNRNVLRRVPKISTARSEGRSGQRKEMNCDVSVSPTGSPGAETALSYLEQRSQDVMHPLFFPTPTRHAPSPQTHDRGLVFG